MKRSGALSFKKLVLILVPIAMIITVSFIVLFVIPVNNLHKNDLRARLQLTDEVKNFPVLEPCLQPRYTYIVPDCGAGTCPDIYEIRYETRAKREMISRAADDYLESLDEPFEYTLHAGSQNKESGACPEILIRFYSLEY